LKGADSMGKIRLYVLCVIILLFGLCLISPVIAETQLDSMGWKFRSDNNNSGVYDDGGERPDGNEIWTYTTRGAISSSPAVADGVIYVGSWNLQAESWNNKLFALNAATGSHIWDYTMGSAVYSSPAVANGVVYVGSYDHNVYALDAATGSHIWTYTTRNLVASSPAVANGVVYVGSTDGNVYALNAATGSQIWNYTTGSAVYSSPAVANGVVYVGSYDHNVYALDAATGSQIWNYTTGSAVYLSSPAVVNGVVYVGSWDNNVYALNAVTGAHIWTYTTGNHVDSSPAVANGVVYVGSYDHNVYALNAATGAHIWTYTTGDVVSSSPAVANGVVYVGSWDDNVYALNAATGAHIWNYTTWNNVDSSPAVANGVVYVGSTDGNVYGLGSFPDNTTNLLIGKSAPQFQENSSIMDYTLSYRNQGPILAENVVLKDFLPNDVEYISATGTPIYDISKGTVTWNLGNIPSFTTGTQSITVRIPSSVPGGYVLNNTANITTTTKEVWYHDNTGWALTTVKNGFLPPGVSLSPYTPSSNGIPSVHYQNQLTFGYHSCPNATGVDIRIHINDGKSDITGSMNGGPPDWHYTTTFYPRHGEALITYTIHGCDIQNVTFPIYIDPAGYIYDTITGERIQGASVWLQWPDDVGNWTNVPTGLIPPPMQPDLNPQITNDDGQYQWDVVEGSYRVYVEADGYKSAASTMVNIPPPVFDLNVGLEPTIVPTTGSISVSSTPSGAQIYLDGSSTGHNTSYTLTGISAGQHIVLLKLAGYKDYNERVTVIAGQTVLMNHTMEPVSPVADFTASPLTGSYPLSVHFTDNSTGLLPLTYQWSFGDGSPLATEKHPVHIYPSAGKFSVNLTVTNSAGNNTRTRPEYINVTTPQPQTYIIKLYPGWNFVSTPKKIAAGSNAVEVVFANVDFDHHSSLLYDGQNKTWIQFTSGVVKPLDGIWVYSKYRVDVPLQFDTTSIPIPPSKLVYRGWNGIGETGVNPISARELLTQVGQLNENWDTLIGINASSHISETYIRGSTNPYFSDLKLTYPTAGYWLQINTDDTLEGLL